MEVGSKDTTTNRITMKPNEPVAAAAAVAIAVAIS
jgi:hypothetical protein